MHASAGRRALVLGGGGILGAAYEVGVLAGLEERFGEGCVYSCFDLFVGTSAGSFVAALIGQAVPPGRLYQAFLSRDPSLYVEPGDVYRIDWAGLLKGALGFGRALAYTSISSIKRGHLPPLLDLCSSGLNRLPAGFIKIDPLEKFLRRIFEGQCLTNSFRDLRKPILIPALDLDRAERKVFGESPDVDPPISLAVTASSAIPRLYGPVQIGASFFVDGAIGGAANVDIALDRGARSVVLLNPIVASCESARSDAESGTSCVCRLVSQGGLGAILDQCMKLEHEAAVTAAVKAARATNKDVSLTLIQPRREGMFLQGAMQYSAHRDVLEGGHRSLVTLDNQTLDQLQQLFRGDGVA